MRHDVDVTDDEFERAVLSEAQRAQPAAQKVIQRAQALACNEPQPTKAAHNKTPDVQGSASSCETLQSRGMEAAGIEPASRNVSTPASTCVAEDLVLALAAPFGRVRFEPARNSF